MPGLAIAIVRCRDIKLAQTACTLFSKTKQNKFNHLNKSSVAPRVGAWIETFVQSAEEYWSWSRLA